MRVVTCDLCRMRPAKLFAAGPLAVWPRRCDVMSSRRTFSLSLSSFSVLILCVVVFLALLTISDELLTTSSAAATSTRTTTLAPLVFHYGWAASFLALVLCLPHLVPSARSPSRATRELVQRLFSANQATLVVSPEHDHLRHRRRHHVVFDELLAAGADPDATSTPLRPLHQACGRGDLLAVELLLAAGCSVSSSQLLQLDWHAPQAIDIVHALIAAGADPSGAPGDALVNACHVNAPAKVVEVLLDAGVNPNCSRLSGHTALHEAARSCSSAGDVSLIRLLLARGSTASARSRTGITPLHVARHWAAVMALIEAGANPNTRSNNSCVPLHMATSDEVAAALIAGGAIVDTYTIPQHLAPVHMASRLQSIPMLLVLLGAGADPNAHSHAGSTLHHAVARFRSAYPAVTLLLGAGALPSATNSRGLTALAYLAERCLSVPAATLPRLPSVSRAIGALLSAGASLDEVEASGEGNTARFKELVISSRIFPGVTDKTAESVLVARWKAEAKEKLL